MRNGLTGKKAIVSGSTRGIGRAVAEEFAKQGASVTLLARDEKTLQDVCKSLDQDHGQEHDYLVADFENTKDLKSIVESYIEKSPTIHILVNNTGGPPAGAIENANIEEFERALKMHLFGNHVLMQAVIESMKKEKYGRIINVVSTSIREPIPNLGVSNVTRAAVASWAKTLSKEVGSYGITVNNILPGYTETERLSSLVDRWAEMESKSKEEIEARMKTEVPAARFATPDETAAAVAFLASPDASYINGVSLAVDGGRTKAI